MDLDLIDKKILYYLDSNARQSIALLAKKLKIGRNVALYRINRLKKEGIIKGSFVEINAAAMGFLNFRIFLKLGNFSKEKQDKLFQYISSHKNISWFSRVLGRWDLDVVFMTKDIVEFENFRNSLMLKFNDIIEESEIAIAKEIIPYPLDYLLHEKRTSYNYKTLKLGQRSNYTPDSKDEEILALLSKDATMNTVDISEKTSLSINTIKKRIKNLEKNKIIVGYRLFLDTEKLGYRYYKLHVYLRKYEENDISRITDWLSSNPKVIYIDRYINGPEFEIELNVKEESDYITFWNNLSKEFGNIIKNHFVITFYDVRIYRYMPEK